MSAVFNRRPRGRNECYEQTPKDVCGEAKWVPVKKINNGSEIENAWAFNMYIATRVNLNTDSKTLYYSIRELKYSPSILKHSQG